MEKSKKIHIIILLTAILLGYLYIEKDSEYEHIYNILTFLYAWVNMGSHGMLWVFLPVSYLEFLSEPIYLVASHSESRSQPSVSFRYLGI